MTEPGLSVAIAEKFITCSFVLISEGQSNLGALLSGIFTLKEHLSSFPLKSVPIAFTIVSPTWKMLPGSMSYDIDTIKELS